jgi:hypothetical protein
VLRLLACVGAVETVAGPGFDLGARGSAVLGYGTTGDGRLDAFDTNQGVRGTIDVPPPTNMFVCVDGWRQLHETTLGGRVYLAPPLTARNRRRWAR